MVVLVALILLTLDFGSYDYVVDYISSAFIIFMWFGFVLEALSWGYFCYFPFVYQFG